MRDNHQREISYFRISITEHCNLRCTYCMGENDPEQPTQEGASNSQPSSPACMGNSGQPELKPAKIQEIVTAAAACGIKKIRITGGEPLVRPDVIEICERIHKVEGIQEVTLTTNGIFLERNAALLKAAGVSRVNISLDTLDPEKYRRVTRWGDIQPVLRGMSAAAQAGLLPIKLNVVLLKDVNEDEIPRFVELTRDEPIEVRFIELMPIGVSRAQEGERYLDGSAVLDAVPELSRVQDSGVASMYRLPGAKGKVGLISPVSRHFCPSCNRIRLTSDGKLKPCLHSDEEIDISRLSGQKLRDAITYGILKKPLEHENFLEGAKSQSGRNMNQIGG